VRPAIAVAAIATAIMGLLGLHVHPAFFSLAGLTTGIVFPASMSSLCHELPLEQHGMAIGIVTGVYNAVLAVAHLAIGALVDSVGVDLALHVGPACAVLGTVTLVLWWWAPHRSMGVGKETDLPPA